MDNAHDEPILPTPRPRMEGFEWSLAQLMDPTTYKNEARRGYGLIEGVGRMGVSCPHCYLQVSADLRVTSDANGVRYCACDDRAYDTDDILAALGLSMYRAQVTKASISHVV